MGTADSAGLSTIGLIHTLIGLAALVAGVLALVTYREIRLDDRYGRSLVLQFRWLRARGAVAAVAATAR